MARKQAQRRKQSERPTFRMPRIPFARIGAALLAVSVLAVSYHYGRGLIDRPITAITIDGPFQRVSALQIEEAISAELERGFLSANLDDIQERLTALPWIDRANVARRWPGQLEISVSEQVPAACWGESGLLNVRGELFVEEARHIPAELPRLSGPEGHADEVAKRYLQIREQLIPRGLDVRSLHLDARGAWEMTLQNGIDIRLGRREVGSRTQLFLDVVADVITRRAKEIKFVDMRYSNGFTIGWNGDSSAPAAIPNEAGPAMLAESSE